MNYTQKTSWLQILAFQYGTPYNTRMEQDRQIAKQQAEFRRSLNITHPLNRKQFVEDRIHDGIRLVAGVAIFIGAHLAEQQIDYHEEQQIAEYCEFVNGDPNCKENDPELYDMRDDRINPYDDAEGLIKAVGYGGAGIALQAAAIGGLRSLQRAQKHRNYSKARPQDQ